MSEPSSLGMKAVSRVPETDRFPFLKALAHLAVADDTVSLDEKQMVTKYTDAWNLEEAAQAEVREILRSSSSSISLKQLVSEFTESGTRFLLVQELVRLAYADGTYGNAERRQIAEIAKRMDMSQEQFRELEKWASRGDAWGLAGGQDDDGIPGEEELQKVVNREREESEHDLSDIETSDSDLSDLSGFEYEEPSEEEEED